MGSYSEIPGLYGVTATMVGTAEQTRWSRLNTYLVFVSFLGAGWLGFTVLIATGSFPYWFRAIAATIQGLLCLTGLIFGCLWRKLLIRSSDDVEMFHGIGERVEKCLVGAQCQNIDDKPFYKSAEKRSSTAEREETSTSTLILKLVPCVFNALFIVLLGLSILALSFASVWK